MYSIMYKRELPWAEDDQDFLLEIGRILGVMVQRIQRAEKDVELRVLDERKRLSEELHDNLAQLVSALSIRTDAVLVSFEKSDEEAALSNLEQLGDVSRTVMKMLRQEMTSLRTPIGDTDGLIEAIRECLEEFERRWGIETHHNLSGIGPVSVPPSAALQLTRILNECLTNVLKHADATDIRVELIDGGDGFSFAVADNGRGFDVSAIAPEKLGIRIMHERAVAAGGKLSIDSGDKGTVVRMDIPRIP